MSGDSGRSRAAWQRNILRAPSLCLALVLLAGCGGGAQDMLETAQLEETQNNLAHARVLYQDIVARYHGTPQAREAAKRLAELDRTPP
jgi:hypothetical protein